jgi:hypothetical protein
VLPRLWRQKRSTTVADGEEAAVADLEDVKTRLLTEIDDVVTTKPGASKRLMELCRAYESLARATPPAGEDR